MGAWLKLRTGSATRGSGRDHQHHSRTTIPNPLNGPPALGLVPGQQHPQPTDARDSAQVGPTGWKWPCPNKPRAQASAAPTWPTWKAPGYQPTREGPELLLPQQPSPAPALLSLGTSLPPALLCQSPCLKPTRNLGVSF